jgi:hypothetical protein
MDFKSFIQRIKSVEKAPQKFFIVDPDLPLSIFFGLDRLNRPTLLIEDIGKVFSSGEIPSTAQILVASFYQREKACLSFSLLSPEHRDVFNTLCYDLFESTRKNTKEKALLSLLDRFYAWQRLLKGSRPGVMSVQEQQGLASELKALLYFSESKGFETALDAWVGPFMMDKDFEFHDAWAEIKSCKVSATVVTISSIEQLDSQLPGKLIVYHLDRIPENKEDAFSLADIVREVRASATSVAARTLLDNKLFLAHYIDNEAEYEKKQFKIYSQDIYNVSGSFPCLRRSSLDSAITACHYSVSLPAVEEFKEVSE